MRWGSKFTSREDMGKSRVVNKYLILPIRLRGEWRWLEWAKIEQRVEFSFSFFGDYAWKNIRWVDE